MEMTKNYSELERYMMARTTMQQIVAGVGASVYYSWGCSKKVYCEIDGKCGLAMRVNGFCFSGWVVILLNGGADLYEVYTAKDVKNLATYENKHTDIYCDQLGSVLDEIIEKGNMSDEEYNARVDKEYRGQNIEEYIFS